MACSTPTPWLDAYRSPRREDGFASESRLTTTRRTCQSPSTHCVTRLLPNPRHDGIGLSPVNEDLRRANLHCDSVTGRRQARRVDDQGCSTCHWCRAVRVHHNRSSTLLSHSRPTRRANTSGPTWGTPPPQTTESWTSCRWPVIRHRFSPNGLRRVSPHSARRSDLSSRRPPPFSTAVCNPSTALLQLPIPSVAIVTGEPPQPSKGRR